MAVRDCEVTTLEVHVPVRKDIALVLTGSDGKSSTFRRACVRACVRAYELLFSHPPQHRAVNGRKLVRCVSSKEKGINTLLRRHKKTRIHTYKHTCIHDIHVHTYRPYVNPNRVSCRHRHSKNVSPTSRLTMRVIGGILASSVASAAAGTDPLSPAYHLTTSTGDLGTLSGFASVPHGEDHGLVYHVFFQRAPAPASWSHLSSSDLVNWNPASNDTAPPVGPAGGSVVAITSGVSPGVSASTLALALGTPVAAGGAVTAATANDAGLGTFTPIADTEHCAGKGVICPSEQASSAPLGAASAFQVPERNGSVVALVVSNESHLVLFESSELTTWTVASAAPLLSVRDTPLQSAELFQLHQGDGQAVVAWSAGAVSATAWSQGTWNPATLQFTETARQTGDVGSFAAAKTTTDAIGQRVQLGTIPLKTSTATGALSLPRQVFKQADGTVGVRAHPAVWQVSE